MRAFLVLCLLAAPAAPAAHASTGTAHSGATRNSLLELYTSKGFSSCPPADLHGRCPWRNPAGAGAASLLLIRVPSIQSERIRHGPYLSVTLRFASNAIPLLSPR